MEHCILVYNSFHKSNLERKQCKLNISYWEGLYARERPHLPGVLPFHYWLLPILEVGIKLKVKVKLEINSFFCFVYSGLI